MPPKTCPENIEPLTDGRLYTTTAAAAYLGLSAKTLANWRVRGGPIPFQKFGRVVRYLGADLTRFVRASRHTSTSEASRSSGRAVSPDAFK